MVRDVNALLARFQDEIAKTQTRALVAEQALAEALAEVETLKADAEKSEGSDD